jgi:sec-independent protein translocase protein TatA
MFDLGATLTPLLLAFGPVGMTELLIIALILVVIFGASKLPQLGRGLGEGIRNFKAGVKDSDPDRLEKGPGGDSAT